MAHVSSRFSSRGSNFFQGLVTGVALTLFITQNGRYSSYLPNRTTEQQDQQQQRNRLQATPEHDTRRETKSCPEIDEESVTLDHLVLRIQSNERVEECKEFWRSNFNFDIENEAASVEYSKNERAEVAYPSVRVSNATVIDLYPVSMHPFYSPMMVNHNDDNVQEDESKDTTATSTAVDHISLKLTGKKMLDVLTKFDKNDVAIERVVGDFFGEDGHHNPMFWGPSGAKGVGIAVFLFEPSSGVYLELRSYDLGSVHKIEKKARAILTKGNNNEKNNRRLLSDTFL